MNQYFSHLKNIAQSSLETNIVETSSGPYLAAGAHQFRTLWTRDFCLSVPGLLAIDRDDVAVNHISKLLTTRRPHDHLVVRGLDSVNPKLRVVAHSVGRWFPGPWHQFILQEPMQTEYLGEHGTPAIDSNALTVLAATWVYDRDPEKHQEWWDKNQTAFEKLLLFYRPYFHRGLIHQPAFSDWQDSSRREGPTFYVNLVYYLAARAFARIAKTEAPTALEPLHKQIEAHFALPNNPLLRAHKDLETVSIDAILLGLDQAFWPHNSQQARSIYHSLKDHTLWSRYEVPGQASDPSYPRSWISWTTWVVGLKNYHDQFAWSWLTALAAKVAARFDSSESHRILQELQRWAERDQTIGEIYAPKKDFKLVRKFLYRSEAPFSWGSAKVLEALEAYHLHKKHKLNDY